MWFTYALLSAVFAGLHTFAVKVAAEKHFDSYLINALAAFLSFLGSLVFFTLTESWAGIPMTLYWLGGASGAVFITLSILRSEALRFIDAALFFPLYKVIGPAIAAFIGILILSEHVSQKELVGIALSCAVPLLLISRHEHHRQKNLSLGLILTVLGATAAAISAALNAYAIDIDPSFTFPLLIVAHGCAFGFGLALFLRSHPFRGMHSAVLVHLTKPFLLTTAAFSLMQFGGFYFMLRAFDGGDMSIVYSINAHYIVIPVILSVWFYGEHWNLRKAGALFLSVLALALLH